MQGWIKTEDALPKSGQKIEMTWKHWECNSYGNFESSCIDQGSYDEYGTFWDSEGPRINNPSFWRPL